MTQPPEQPPYPPGGWQPPPPVGRPTSGKAVTALVLGILGLIACGPFTAVPAIFLGRSAVREVDASQGRLDGRAMGTAGFVLGIVGTVLWVVVGIAVVGLIALGAAVSTDVRTCTATPTGGDCTLG